MPVPELFTDIQCPVKCITVVADGGLLRETQPSGLSVSRSVAEPMSGQMP